MSQGMVSGNETWGMIVKVFWFILGMLISLALGYLASKIGDK